VLNSPFAHPNPVTTNSVILSLRRRTNQLFRHLTFAALLLALFSPAAPAQALSASTQPLQLSRPARTWEFLPAVGQRAAFFGEESGRMEAWVYPLKLLRDLHLIFHTGGENLPGGEAIPADSLARSIVVRPESASILYAGDNFTVRETFFVPVQESGALILFDIYTEQPLDIEVAFQADFQLEWPGAIGGTDMEIAPDNHGFLFGAEAKHFFGIVGSPTGANLHAEYQTNYSASQQSSFRLGVTARGSDQKIVALAASTGGLQPAEATYNKLTSSWRDLLHQSADYYRDYLAKTISLELPDAQLQQAYDWARVSVIQGLVNNPQLGPGLIAGYRISGDDQRPGFAWFFGRDSLWTSFALNASGDTATSRTALAFITKFQRDDGKIPHEISQAAGLVDWFKDFPFAYASADATPLYIIAMNDYLLHSGDTAFIKEKWPSIVKAYQFLKSTWNAQGFPKNFGIGHGWVEGGPLLPVQSELYQSGLGVEALSALANLARATGQQSPEADLDQLFSQHKSQLNDAFWLSEKNRYAFALDQQDHAVDELSVLSTVPMWFGLLDAPKADETITQLAAPDHQTDWGMRIISSSSKKFGGEGYHFGSVWPLFTGWAAVGEYRYHRPHPAYANLRSNALLTFDGSLGHVTEVLSGTDFESLSTSSPHQIWSAAMVISPILRGLFGLESDALTHTLSFTPHVPADWSTFAIRNIPIASDQIDLRYRKSLTDITLEVTRNGSENVSLDFAPALSLRAKVLGVDLNGHPTQFHIAENETDQHVQIHVPLITNSNTIRIRLKNDFDFSYNSTLPMLGESSQGLRILSESWSPDRDTLTVEAAGVPGATYDLALWSAQQIHSIDGAKLIESPGSAPLARVQFPAANTTPAHSTIVFRF
jgi:glycogen debranching enzyme